LRWHLEKKETTNCKNAHARRNIVDMTPQDAAQNARRGAMLEQAVVRLRAAKKYASWPSTGLTNRARRQMVREEKNNLLVMREIAQHR
jgi:hypothetical protein